MMQTNVEILKKRINKVHIELAHNVASGFKLRAESRVEVKTPKKEEEKTVLVLIEISIGIPDSDDVDIVINAEIIFGMDEIPSDYNSLIEEKCIPLAQENLFKTLDEILIKMGYKKLGLAEK